MFVKNKKIHLIGIGGSGMSGIAEVLINLGCEVSGSDAANSDTIEHLTHLGAKIKIGHESGNIENADVVVISSAISRDNVEVVKAKERHIPVIPRAEMLAELMRLKRGIAIAGTHGKTTTTSMIASILGYAKLDPTVVIGGKLNSMKSGAKLGAGDLLVAEADESDGSFLKLSHVIAVVTTIDQEHMDFYKNIDNLLNAFLAFINKVPFYGAAILCLDQPYIQGLIPKVEKRYITYGLNSQSDYTAADIVHSGLTTSFTVCKANALLGSLTINIPGVHNVLNSLAAVAVSIELGISFEDIKNGLLAFSGVQRRFQIIGEKNHITVVDDYGHHPEEIKAVLKAARDVWGKKKRVIVLFQPHRYSRTRDLLKEFLTVFYDADILILTDIYSAGEKPVEGISSELLYKGIKEHGHKDVSLVKNKNNIADMLIKRLSPEDVIITLGAGDIWKTGRELLQKI